MQIKFNHFYRGSRLIYGYLQSYLNNRLHILGPLHKLAISVTGRCNSRCITCNIWQNKPETDKEINLKDLKFLTESRLFKSVRSITLTGGEPFLRNDIADIIETLSRNTSADIFIITNGLMPDRILSTVKDVRGRGISIDKITLSLNGKPETHDKTRGIEGNYCKVIDTVKGLKDLGVFTSLIFTITKENCNQIEWVYDLSKELRVDINYYPEVNSYRFENLNGERAFNEKQKDIVLKQLKNIFRKRKYYYFDDSTLYFISRMFQNKQVCQCHSGLQSAFINWDGEVYACEVFNQRRFSFGNIKENMFDEIWNSNKAGEIRKYIKEGKCQPCYLACEIIQSLRKEIFPIITYMCKRRLLG
ncbi:MAG: radical SAM protein [Thermodesulfobacteriota bacterium]